MYYEVAPPVLHTPVFSPYSKTAYETHDTHHMAAVHARGPAGYAPVPASEESRRSPPASQRLPGLGDLLASKLLIAPGAKRDSACEIEQPIIATQDKTSSIPDSSACSLARYSLARKRSFSEFVAEDASEPPHTRNSSHSSRSSTLHALLNPEPEKEAAPRLAAIKSIEHISPHTSPVSDHFPSTSSTTSSNNNHHPPGLATTFQRPSISPYELAPTFYGSSDLAPATYVYQAPSPYEGIQYVPGRGECHIYKGGYCIPTGAFGDPMSLSKSKILKKRLSVACTNCRRKKIRCEPGVQGCLQCRKSGKPCQIEPAKRRLKTIT